MSEYNIPGYGVYNESVYAQFMLLGYGLILDPTSDTSVSPSAISSGEAHSNTTMMKGTIQSEV